MKKPVFTGVATALVTPMHEDTSVNFERLTSLVNEQIAGGVDALVICGTTGEKSTLNYADHVKVIETAVKAAAGRVPIIAGAGSNDTVYSVGLCNDAVAVGADALLMRAGAAEGLPAYDAVVPLRFAPLHAPERFDERAGLVTRLAPNIARVNAALAVTVPTGQGRRMIERIEVM